MNRREFLKSLLSVPFGWKALFRKEDNFLPTDGAEEIIDLSDGPMMAYELPPIDEYGNMISDSADVWPEPPPIRDREPFPLWVQYDDGIIYCPDIDVRDPQWYREITETSGYLLHHIGWELIS